MSTPPSSAPDDALLLCVDMQPKFVAAVQHGSRIRRRCEFAVAAAVGIGIPVAFTEQVPQKLGNTAPELLALAPRAEVWSKNTFSALADQGIRDTLLHQRDIEHILLCGIETPICVYQTAIAAIAEGLQVTVLSDAIGARREADARACVESLAREGAHILPAETIFYSLLHHVNHPYFRDYTKLVKLHDVAVDA